MKIHANIIKMIHLDAPNKVWSSMHQRPQQIVQSGVEVLRKRRPWFHVVDVQVGSGSYPEAIAPGNTALAAQHSQLGSEQMADKAERTGRLVEYWNNIITQLVRIGLYKITSIVEDITEKVFDSKVLLKFPSRIGKNVFGCLLYHFKESRVRVVLTFDAVH